jgi:hypothetical protein
LIYGELIINFHLILFIPLPFKERGKKKVRGALAPLNTPPFN